MAVDHLTHLDDALDTPLVDEQRTIIPAAFYSDEEPPEPPADDPHWREFPMFESMRAGHLLVAGIVAFVLFSVVAHMMILLAIR